MSWDLRQNSIAGAFCCPFKPIALFLGRADDVKMNPPSEPSVAEFVSAGFKAGVPCRRLLEAASSRFGTLWFKDTSVQDEIVATALDEIPFRYGRREQTLLRLIVDELDRSCNVLSDKLISAACTRLSSINESSPYMLVQVGCSRIRISSSFSDLGRAFRFISI